MMFALYGFGILVSALSLVLKEGWIVAEGLHSIMMILSSVTYPLIMLPNIARQASSILPTAPALVGMRVFLIEDYTPEVVGNRISTSLSFRRGVHVVRHFHFLFNRYIRAK